MFNQENPQLLGFNIFQYWTTTSSDVEPRLLLPQIQLDPTKKKKPGTFDLAADSAVVDLFQDHQAFHLMAESENRKG